MHRFMILLTVAFLIPAGAEVQAKEKDGETPLHVAKAAWAGEIPPYDRAEWGMWADADGDCQNTSQEVLLEESTQSVTFASDAGCRVVSGQWIDPLTGQVYTLASELDVDHLVPVANAHASGGWRWSREKKRAYFNDLTNLAHLNAVSGSVNKSKGRKGPEEWRPPDVSAHCQYATEWIAIKEEWGLSVSDAERLALDEMLETCGEHSFCERRDGRFGIVESEEVTTSGQ